MMMPKEKRVIQKEDIMPLDVYTSQRKELRKSILEFKKDRSCLLYTSPSPRDLSTSRMPSSA